jgi:serine/threonine-protein kinase RsbW
MKEGFTIIETMKLPSDLSSLVDIEALINKVGETLEVNEEVYGNVLIAVTEAVNNAIIHGNKSAADLLVEVAVGNGEENFCFKIVDGGQGFDFNDLPDPTAPENILKENGRGIFLMKNLADEVEFENGGNTVSLYFNK